MPRVVIAGSTLLAALSPGAALAAPAAGLFTLCLAGASLVGPGEVWTAFSLAPEVLAPLAALLVAYGLALARRPAAPGQVAAFAAGYGFLVLALVSPLCRLAATLASAHMVQHVILVALAPPLLLLGLPERTRRAVPCPHPLLAGLLYALAIWAWHVPRFYEAALLDPLVHLALYASLLAAATLFWASMMGGLAETRSGWIIPVLLATLIQTGLLGALLTFSPHIWFPVMSPGAALWGMTPLEDQQLAGLIMWVPMGAIYLASALFAFAAVLQGSRAERALGFGRER